MLARYAADPSFEARLSALSDDAEAWMQAPIMRTWSFRSLSVVLPVVFIAVGCVDERIVYEDVRFPPLPDGAASFVGYSDNATKETVCGNCHVGQHADWETSAHSGAWETLEESGGAQDFCRNCHTVGQLGNSATAAGGWESTHDERYYDVQCESCHGPGLAHIENPDIDANVPLAPMAVGGDLTIGCGECHNGTHHPFVEEWEQSGHGRVQASPAGRAECNACHTAENALLAWGVRDEYLEKTEVLTNATSHLPITCGVCHDVHANENEGQLRFPIDVPSEEENLCMKCHHKRGVPDPTTFRGPHSPEGPVLLGYGGWWPPNMEFPEGGVAASHGSESNPRLCAGCHVTSYTVTDEATGDFQFNSTGHLFQAIPCLENGIPTTGDCGLAERSFRSCTGAGCHASEDVGRSLLTLVETRVEDLVEELDALLLLVPAAEFSTTDNRYTTAEGSRFNSDLAKVAGSGVHNPVLIETLLRGSIRQVREDYALASQTGVSLEQQLGR
jgi:predicted CXXCH cytochrome family protein